MYSDFDDTVNTYSISSNGIGALYRVREQRYYSHSDGSSNKCMYCEAQVLSMENY